MINITIAIAVTAVVTSIFWFVYYKTILADIQNERDVIINAILAKLGVLKSKS